MSPTSSQTGVNSSWPPSLDLGENSSSAEKTTPSSKEINFTQIIDQNDFYCPIAGTIMKTPVSLTCGHSFEEKAIKEWFEKNKKRICPVCNQENSHYTKNIFLQNTIKEWKKHAKPEGEEGEEVTITKVTPKLITSEEVQAKLKDTYRIFDTGPEGKELATEMLLNYQNEYPEQPIFSQILNHLLNKESIQQYTSTTSTSQVTSQAPMSITMQRQLLSAQITQQIKSMPIAQITSQVPMSITMQGQPLSGQATQQVRSMPTAQSTSQASIPTIMQGQPLSGQTTQQARSMPIAQSTSQASIPTIMQGQPLSEQITQQARSMPISQFTIQTPIPATMPMYFQSIPSQQLGSSSSSTTSTTSSTYPLSETSGQPSLKRHESSLDSSHDVQVEHTQQSERPEKRIKAIADLFELAELGEFKTFKAELTKDRESSQITDNKGNSLLHQVVLSKREVKFIDLLRKIGVDVNQANKSGETALHIAARIGSVRHINKLLETGANQNIENAHHRKPYQLTSKAKLINLLKPQEVLNEADVNTLADQIENDLQSQVEDS